MPSTKRKVDQRGDVLEDSSRRQAQATQLVRYCVKWALPQRDWPILRSVTLYPPAVSRNGSWLVVGKAWGDQKRLVAFHRSTDPLTALVGFLQKWFQATLVWKEDTWVGEKDA